MHTCACWSLLSCCSFLICFLLAERGLFLTNSPHLFLQNASLAPGLNIGTTSDETVATTDENLERCLMCPILDRGHSLVRRHDELTKQQQQQQV